MTHTIEIKDCFAVELQLRNRIDRLERHEIGGIMIRGILLLFVSIWVFPATTWASQADIEEAFEALKQSGSNYTVFGVICEDLALLKVVESYPSEDYEIANGIEYSNGDRTLGELDLVIIDRVTNEAQIIIEVKCWRNLSKARAKAARQLKRFEDTIESGAKIYLYLRNDRKVTYSAMQFDENPEMIAYSQLGGKEFGFEDVLSLDLDEVKILRTRLMDCQAIGECAPPRLLN